MAMQWLGRQSADTERDAAAVNTWSRVVSDTANTSASEGYVQPFYLSPSDDRGYYFQQAKTT